MKFLRTLIAVIVFLPAVAFAHPAEDLIDNITSDLISALKDPKAESDETFLRDTLNSDVLPHVDFTTMTKITLGVKHWKAASKEQRKELVKEFRELLLTTYMTALDQYSGQEDYKLRTTKADRNTWKVYDIEVESVSLVKSYKAEFSSQIKQAGVEGLIGTLREKNAN